ncbi:ProQ/FINO family protein [Paraburkholderia caballeronis]|nr:ProQ/FINO family protein [Paraburkholderia caballeronis]
MIRYHSAGSHHGRELDVKAASQQRRTLSFKEGLQEIKKTWGLTSGQPPEEKPQPDEGRRARQQGAGAKESREPRARDARPKGQPPRGPGAKPQQQAGQGKPGGNRGPAPQRAQQKPQQRPQQRPRPAKPLPANLSDEERARIERNRQLNAVWNVLAKHHPTFRDRLPLKIGVIDDLCARHPDLERTVLVAVLKRHVNHPRYHERVAAGGPRYELDGTPSAGPGIDPSHIARANAALARQKAKADARAKEASQPQNPPSKPAGDSAAAPADEQAAPLSAVQPVDQAAPQSVSQPASQPAPESLPQTEAHATEGESIEPPASEV